MGRIITADGDIFNRASRERRQRPKYEEYDYKEILGNIHTAGAIAKQASDVMTGPLVKGLTGSQSPFVRSPRVTPAATPGGTAMDQAVAQRAQATRTGLPLTPTGGTPFAAQQPGESVQPQTPQERVSLARGQQVNQAAQTSRQAQIEAQQAQAAASQPQAIISPPVGKEEQKPATLYQQVTAAHDPVWQTWAIEGKGAQPRFTFDKRLGKKYDKALRSGISVPAEQIQVWIQEAVGQTARIYSQDATVLAHLATAIQHRETGSGEGYDRNGVLGPYANDPGAISVTGPVGLFQFNQKTWREAAKRAGAPEDLGGRLDPELATAVAVDHLGYLLQRAGGDINKAAQLYHGTAADQITNPGSYGTAVEAAVNELAAAASQAPAPAPVTPAATQGTVSQQQQEQQQQQQVIEAPLPGIAPPGLEDREAEIRAGTFVVPNVRPDVVSANTLQLMSRNALDQGQKNWVHQLALEADQANALNYEFTDWTDLFSGKARSRFMKNLEAGMPATPKPKAPMTAQQLATLQMTQEKTGAYRRQNIQKPIQRKQKDAKPFDYKANLGLAESYEKTLKGQLATLESSLATGKPINMQAFEAKIPVHINATQSQKKDAFDAWDKARKEIANLRNMANLTGKEAQKKLKSAVTRLRRELKTVERLKAAIGKSQSQNRFRFAASPDVLNAWAMLYQRKNPVTINRRRLHNSLKQYDGVLD